MKNPIITRSTYEAIESATELVHTIIRDGMSTATEDICRMQDIFGNAPIDELADLANNIGRTDGRGNPDPKGTFNGGRETRSTFYHILFTIWNYEDATRFWNQHSNPEHDELKALREERRELKAGLAREQEAAESLRRVIDDLQDKLAESEKDWEAAHAANHALAEEKDAEIAALREQLLSETDLSDLAAAIRYSEEDDEAAAQKAAAAIVAAAENPDSEDFRRAVSEHRAFSKAAEYKRNLRLRVEAAETAAHNINAGA